MSKQKPHYLPLLNTIAVHERNSGISLKTWANTTPDPELKKILEIVAARETSHYYLFKRRIEELGYEMDETEAEPGHEERLQIRSSNLPDGEKLRRVRELPAMLQVPYREAGNDPSIDPLTRSLLRFFADEEADSIRLLDAAYGRIENG